MRVASATIDSVPGPRILVTRSPRQSSALADRLRELGTEPVLIPTIEIADPDSYEALDTALAHLQRFDWIVFTSANAVEALTARLKTAAHTITIAAKGLLQRPADHGSATRGAIYFARYPRVAAIGPATARALVQVGFGADLLPAQAVAESFAEALLPYAHRPDGSPGRFLLVRAEEARELLPDALRAAGAEVTVAPAYRTVVPAAFIPRMRALFSPAERDSLREAPLAAVTFTSASTVRNLAAMLEAAGSVLPPEVVRASIGPITSAALRDLAWEPHVQADETTVDSLAAGLVKYLAKVSRL